jgi:hypothetical protein
MHGRENRQANTAGRHLEGEEARESGQARDERKKWRLLTPLRGTRNESQPELEVWGKMGDGAKTNRSANLTSKPWRYPPAVASLAHLPLGVPFRHPTTGLPRRPRLFDLPAACLPACSSGCVSSEQAAYRCWRYRRDVNSAHRSIATRAHWKAKMLRVPASSPCRVACRGPVATRARAR